MITVDLDVFSYSPIDSPCTKNVQDSLCKQLKKVGDASSYIESKLSPEAYVKRILHKEHYHVLEHAALELNFDITATLFSEYREHILRSFRYIFNNIPPSSMQTKIVDAPSGGQSDRFIVTINLKDLRDTILVPLQLATQKSDQVGGFEEAVAYAKQPLRELYRKHAVEQDNPDPKGATQCS